MTQRSVLILTVFLLNPLTASAQLGEITKRLSLGKTTDLPDSKIASGLKEALQVGAGNAVKLTGQPDGYFKNEAIKILMSNPVVGRKRNDLLYTTSLGFTFAR